MHLLVNIFNLFFLLVVNPLAAILLITRSLAMIDPTHMTINEPWILMVLEIVGLVMYVIGYFLMAWALITLRRNYQLGGSAPRSEDKMVMDGPYFYRVPVADDATRQSYLERAYKLGKEFA